MKRTFELNDDGWFFVTDAGVKIFIACGGGSMSTWDLMKRAEVADTAIRAHEARLAAQDRPAKEAK